MHRDFKWCVKDSITHNPLNCFQLNSKLNNLSILNGSKAVSVTFQKFLNQSQATGTSLAISDSPWHKSVMYICATACLAMSLVLKPIEV